MASPRAEVAMRRRTVVMLNLAELEMLLGAGLDKIAETGGTGRRARRHAPPDLCHAVDRVHRARDRRLRAVKRAGG